MVNCKWSDHMVKIVFCQKSTKIPVLAVFWPPAMDRSVEFPFGLRRGRAASRPSEGVSTLGAGDALGMTTSGVLDDEALQLALKDASVKGKLSLAYLDLTEITSEQATRVRAGAPNITSWTYGRTTSRTCPMSSATSRRCG